SDYATGRQLFQVGIAGSVENIQWVPNLPLVAVSEALPAGFPWLEKAAQWINWPQLHRRRVEGNLKVYDLERAQPVEVSPLLEDHGGRDILKPNRIKMGGAGPVPLKTAVAPDGQSVVQLRLERPREEDRSVAYILTCWDLPPRRPWLTYGGLVTAAGLL